MNDADKVSGSIKYQLLAAFSGFFLTFNLIFMKFTISFFKEIFLTK